MRGKKTLLLVGMLIICATRMRGIIPFLMATLIAGTLLAGSIVAVAIESSDFDDPTVCKGCHSEIYNQWDGSMHSIAYTGPVYLDEGEMASRETDGLTDTYCARCHTPIGILSGEVPPIGLENLSEISKKGIQCDFCHSVNKSTGIGNGAFSVSLDGTKRGPYGDSKSPYHGSMSSELHTKSEFCGMCHDVNHPMTGIPIEATYTEWKEGPYSTTTQCQDCHMTPGITHFETNPGKASGIGPYRNHVHTHYFVGGNAAVTGVIGSEVHQQMAEERLKSAATLALEAEKKDNEAEITVKVTNAGAGHKLPTGLTEAREVWIEILAKDASGKEIYHSGGLDSDGEVDPDAVMYHAVLADASGKPTVKVWEAESKLSDNRILPKETRVEKFNFAIPSGVKAPITVDAKLNYRSASQKLLDELFGEGAVVAPVIEIASAQGTIEVLLLSGAIGSAQAGDWPMFRHDPSHAGYTNEKISGDLKLLWCYEAPFLLGFERSSPAVADGKVFIGSNDYAIYCLNADTGRLIWRYETDSQVYSSPAVADGKVFVGSNDHKVYCLDTDTGDLIWHYGTVGVVDSSPTVADGKVFVGSSGGKLYCLDADTGRFLWQYKTGSMYWSSPSSPAVANGKVFFGSKNDDNIYCLDADTGAFIWSNKTYSSSPAVANGKVFFRLEN